MSDDLNYTAAEAWNLSRKSLIVTNILKERGAIRTDVRASNVHCLISVSAEVYTYHYDTDTLYTVVTVSRYLAIVIVYQAGYHVLLQLVLRIYIDTLIKEFCLCVCARAYTSYNKVGTCISYVLIKFVHVHAVLWETNTNSKWWVKTKGTGKY